MADDSRFMIVLSTVPSKSVGLDIAREVVAERLAACVNILPGVVSVFEWDVRMEESNEALLVMKTSADRAKALIEKVKKLHPYEIPEIIAVPIHEGHGPYLDWIESIVGLPEKKEVSTE